MLKRTLIYFGVITAIAIEIIVLASVLAVVAFEFVHREKIYPGVEFLGVDLGGLKPEEAEDILRYNFESYREEKLVLRYGERSWPLLPHEVGASLDFEAIVESAYAVGRGNSLLDDLLEQARVLLYGTSIQPIFEFDEGVARVFISRLTRDVNQPLQNARLILRGLQAEALPSKAGREVDLEATIENLYQRIRNLSGGEVELVVRETQPQIPDASDAKAKVEMMLSDQLVLAIPYQGPDTLGPWTLERQKIADMLVIEGGEGKFEVGLDQVKLREFVQRIAEEIKKEPKNARFEFDDGKGELVPIVPSEDGRELDIEETIRLLNAKVATDERNVSLPIITLRPQIKEEDAPNLGVIELVVEEKTSFRGSSSSRLQNIRISSSRFHGLIILPGEVFSFNEYLGEVSAEAGYKEAPIIWGDRLRQALGGGVCQVATTAFRVAFWGGYPIVERHPHAFRIFRYEPPAGLDATVYPPYDIDLKFENDTPYHILIETEMDMEDKTISFRFYSTKTGRTVEIEGPFIENIVPHGPPIYEEDPTLPKGTIKQVEWARDGMDVTIYRIVKRGDEVVKKDLFFTRYRPWRAVYLVGTKEE
jgi:vancomycin resistance protein YoaR